jgi:hypothetical protein
MIEKNPKISHEIAKISSSNEIRVHFSPSRYIEADPSKDSLREFTINFQKFEAEYPLDPFYLLKGHKLLTPENRKSLYLWVSAVAYRGFNPPIEFPLFETIRLLDIFLSHGDFLQIRHQDLHKIALASLVVAADIKDFRYSKFKDALPEILDSLKEVYSRRDIGHWVDRINQIMPTVHGRSFLLLQVNSKLFYNFVASSLGVVNEAYYFGCMLLELALLDHAFLRFKQSVIGLACACLVFEFFCGGNALEIVSQLESVVDKQQLRVCSKELARLTQPENVMSLVQEKYQQTAYKNVSRFFFTPQSDQLKKRSSSLP